MHFLSLKGMNYGEANNPKHSGELNLLKLLKRNFHGSEVTILDIGGNMGQYALLVKKVFGDTVNLYSFEPSGKAFDRLKKNSLKYNFQAYKFGFSNLEKEIQLFGSESGGVISSVYQLTQDDGVVFEPIEKIEVKILDKFCQENLIEHIDFLKIDVEGHELEVLRGAQNMLQEGKIDYIQFEFGSQNIASKAFLSDFFNLLDKYNIYRVLQNGIFQIQYNYRYEIFLTSNYFAIRKNL